MSLQLIIGSSGSGKTRYLYQNLIKSSIDNPQTQYFAIVPEQFTMQTQKEIVSLHPNHGTMNIDIVSFQRLAYRIFEELAIEHLVVLDDIGKSMILRKILTNQQKKLEVFKGNLHQMGFIHQLKSMLSELYQYGINPADLQMTAADGASSLLQAKLKNLAIVYQSFQEYIEHRYITTEEILDVLCKVLPTSQLIKQSVISLDGYTGFTPVQYRVLELLLNYSSKVMITVTAEPAQQLYQSSPIHDLFYMSKQMIQKMQQLAQKHKIVKEPDILLEAEHLPRFKQAPAISFLEKHLFRFSNAVYSQPQQEIQIYQALNPIKEVSFVVNQIHQYLQQDLLRYRNIAVITGDLETYGRELAFQFEREGIPYFLDDKKSILDNPMVEWIRAILEVVQSDFSYESVFRYLKTGLVLPDEQMELLFQMENYVLALGIRGYKKWNCCWEKELRRNPYLNLKAINELREQFLEPLHQIRDAFSTDQVTIEKVTTALMECLEHCHIQEKMQQYEAAFHQSGDFGREKEYSQIYDLVMDLFQRLNELLGDEQVSKKEYREIVDAGFGELEVGVIPATQDQVMIGDITRTRLDGVGVLFLVGVNDGIIPAVKGANTLLTDAEREVLKEHQIELAPTAKEDGFIQRFYLYLILTKPEKQLILSYSALTSAGKSQRPSSLLHAIQKLYPDLIVAHEGTRPIEIYSPEEGKQRLMEGLNNYQNLKNDDRLLALYQWFLTTDKYQQSLKGWLDAAFYSDTEKGIGSAAATQLYGDVLSGSVTRLEQYAACAYAHFLRYGLELQEKREYQLEAVDLGNLFHESIYQYFITLQLQNQNWNEINDQQQKELVKQCVDQVTQEYGNSIMHSSARMKYLSRKVERMTNRTIWALTQQLSKGDFEPLGFEVAFSARDQLKAMKIPLSPTQEMHLKGRIDRLDIYEEDDQVYIKIIDYKSGSKKFDLVETYYGLQLQLIVYLDAVMEMEARKYPGKKMIPAGVFYYQINDPLIERSGRMTPAEVDDQILAELRMSGLVNRDLEAIKHLDDEIEQKSDVIPVTLKNGMIQESYSSVASEKQFDQLQQYVHHQLKRYGNEILNGTVDIHPYKQGTKTACDYCPYHSICGFDDKQNKHTYRRLKGLKPQEVWEIIEEDADGNELDPGTTTGNLEQE